MSNDSVMGSAALSSTIQDMVTLLRAMARGTHFRMLGNDVILTAAADKLNAFEPMREALRRLANAADRVGMRHFDTDDNSPEVEEMSEATLNARAALKLAGDAC